MTDTLASAYPWLKALHIASVIAWMAGLFYLPRLFVYHVERGPDHPENAEMLIVMEEKLLRIIMNPAMISSWVFGLLLAVVLGWSGIATGWFLVKVVSLILMTAFHMWLASERKKLLASPSHRTGRAYRLANEVPTVLMLVIVVMVVVKPF